MVWYEWYGIWYGMNGMVWYSCTTVRYVIWYGMNGMVWYSCTTVRYVIWYGICYGMV